MISIVALLEAIGLDNVNVQYLTQDLHGNQRRVGHAVQVSFLTDPKNLNLAELAQDRPTSREGIVCWVDRPAMEIAMSDLRAAANRPANLAAEYDSPEARANTADYQRAHAAEALRQVENFLASMADWPVGYFSEAKWHRAWQAAVENERGKLRAALRAAGESPSGGPPEGTPR